MNHRRHVEAVRGWLRAEGAGALIVFDPTNIRYLTGFASIAYSRPLAALIPAAGPARLVVPQIERSQAHVMTQARLHSYGEWSFDGVRAPGFDAAFLGVLTEALRAANVRGRLAMEDRSASRRSARLFATHLRSWRPRTVAGVVEEFRLRKGESEVARIREAAAVALAGMRGAWRAARPGASEIAIRSQGDAAAVRFARTRLPARTVVVHSNVLAGPRIAAIHTPASAHPVRRGDLAYLVWMVAVDGYWIELARTVPVGRPSRRQRALYRTVREAHELAGTLIRPGTVADDVDVAARQFLARSALGRYFHHRTGHGVGLAGVERPNLGVGDRTRLEAGMVVSIEPGICIEGFGGLGSSDTLLVRPAGCEWLTPQDFLHEAWEG